VFPLKYELNLYILFRRNSVFKGMSYSCVEVRSNTERNSGELCPVTCLSRQRVRATNRDAHVNHRTVTMNLYIYCRE
jgi:hypothetical protein